MLPPESTQAIFLHLTSTLLLRTAASGVAPVSYTHLSDKSVNHSETKSHRVTSHSVPVSYTHLDVYKRQLILKIKFILTGFKSLTISAVYILSVPLTAAACLHLSLIHILIKIYKSKPFFDKKTAV